MDNGEVNDALDLGTMLGRKQAFGLLAGRCSAADAECLRRMREEKKYLALGMNWDEFCKRKIGMSRPTVDRIVRSLEEFGPRYFELAAVLKIAPEQYRQIAAAVTEDGVICGGETIAISADNSARLAEAVESLRESAAAAQEAETKASQIEVFEALRRARKAFREGMKSYVRAIELASPACDPIAIRREIETIRKLLEVNVF